VQAKCDNNKTKMQQNEKLQDSFTDQCGKALFYPGKTSQST